MQDSSTSQEAVTIEIPAEQLTDGTGIVRPEEPLPDPIVTPEPQNLNSTINSQPEQIQKEEVSTITIDKKDWHACRGMLPGGGQSLIQCDCKIGKDHESTEKPKHPGGRPCEFCKNKDEIIRITKEFIESCYIPRKNSERPRHIRIPYFEELALELDVDDETIGLWANKRDNNGDLEHPEFSASIKRIRTMQKMMLLKSTMGKNPTGSIFQLKANHGMIESEKRIHAGDINEPLEIVITEAKRTYVEE